MLHKIISDIVGLISKEKCLAVYFADLVRRYSYQYNSPKLKQSEFSKTVEYCYNYLADLPAQEKFRVGFFICWVMDNLMKTSNLHQRFARY